jgi:sodium/hydrogen antiporter
MCQIVHGLSIPLGKLGFYLPRTISRGVLSPSAEGLLAVSPFAIGSRVTSFGIRRRSGEDLENEPNNGTGRSVFRIGGSVIPAPQEDPSGKRLDRREGPTPVKVRRPSPSERGRPAGSGIGAVRRTHDSVP